MRKVIFEGRPLAAFTKPTYSLRIFFYETLITYFSGKHKYSTSATMRKVIFEQADLLIHNMVRVFMKSCIFYFWISLNFVCLYIQIVRACFYQNVIF